jgi:hypothetical protein
MTGMSALIAEHEQRLADSAGGSLHEHALSGLHTGRTVKQQVCGRPAQNQRGRLRRVDTRRHADQAAGSERAIGSVRPDHRHIGHPVAELKAGLHRAAASRREAVGGFRRGDRRNPLV